MSVVCVCSAQGLTVLHLAASEGHLDCMRLLVERYDFDVNQPSIPAGWRPLHLCCGLTDHLRASDCVNYLLSAGADTALSVVCLSVCLSVRLSVCL